MGDALRNVLGISGKWTERERELYSHFTPEKLGPLYAIENIPKDQPSERARYLDKKLEIKDEGVEEKKILDICKEHNKAIALLNLEKLVIKKFF